MLNVKDAKKGLSERRLVSSTGWKSKKQGQRTQKEGKGSRILVEEVEVLVGEGIMAAHRGGQMTWR